MKRIYAFIAIIVVFLGAAFYMTRKPAADTSKKSEVKTVGILQLMTHPALDSIHKGIIAGLKERGYTVGKNLKIDFQNAEGDQSNMKTMSERFVNEKEDLVIGIATPAAQALANATKTTPIILGAITDPKGAKLVANNERPGGNITGVSDQAPIEAQLKLIKELTPKAKTLGVIATSSDDSAQTQAKMVEQLAPKLGFKVKRYSISSTNDLQQVAGQMVTQVDAVFVPTDNTIASAMQTLVSAANSVKVPVYPTVDTMVKDGGLATIGINQYKLGVETGKMAGDVLNGDGKPATMPIHFEKTGQLIVNLKEAKGLGITIPSSVLSQAKKDGEVIQ